MFTKLVAVAGSVVLARCLQVTIDVDADSAYAPSSDKCGISYISSDDGSESYSITSSVLACPTISQAFDVCGDLVNDDLTNIVGSSDQSTVESDSINLCIIALTNSQTHVMNETYIISDSTMNSRSISVESTDNNDIDNKPIITPEFVNDGSSTVEQLFDITGYGTYDFLFENIQFEGAYAENVRALTVTSSTAISLIIRNCIFNEFELTSESDNGAAIQITESISVNENNATTNDILLVMIYNSTFTNCIATQEGGVIEFVNHQFYVNVTESVFQNNQAFAGGVFKVDASGDYVLRSLLDESIDITIFEFEFRNCKFESNYVEFQGGVIYVKYPTDYDYFWPNEFTFDNCEFLSNSADYYGGVLRYYSYQESDSSDYECDRRYRLITFKNSYFMNNTATSDDSSYGGVAAVTCTEIHLFDNELYENSAYLGGCFSIYASLTNGSDNIFSKNSAGLSGPAIYANGLYNDTQFQLYMYNSQFNENSGDQSSAIMFAFMHYGLIKNCTFTNNHGIEGGAVAVYYWSSYAACYIHIIDCEFSNNIMTDRDAVSGGAITAAQWQLSNQDRNLVCVDISDVDGSNNGDKPANLDGIEYTYDEMMTGITPPTEYDKKTLLLFVVNSRFVNNSYAAIGLLVTTLVVYNCEFISNYNEEYGGAIESQYSWFYVKNSSFIDNTANDCGGAISTIVIDYTKVIEEYVLPNGCPHIVESSYFEGNHAQLGGGLQISITSNIFNNVFYNNTGLFGGGLAYGGKTNNIYNNTFSYDHVTTLGGCLFRTSYSNHKESELLTEAIYTNNDATNETTVEYTNSVLSNIYNNEFNQCEAYVGGCVYLGSLDPDSINITNKYDIDDIFNVTNNKFNGCYASDIGGGLVLGQQYYTTFMNVENFNDTNQFIDCKADTRHDEFTSYPNQLYINTESSVIPPGINKGAELGGLDIFNNTFESYIITDWNKDETHFEFVFLSYDVRFQISTVDKGSLTLGDATIQFSIINDTFNRSVTIGLTTNMDEELLNIENVNYTFELTVCPQGYGYTEDDTCELCELGYWNTQPGKEACHECVDGLSCRGSTNVEIETNFWWDDNYPNVDIALPCRAGQCCQSESGCGYNDTNRCPTDRNYTSLGCGICNDINGKQSAKHGSNECGDCSEFSGKLFNGLAIAVMIIWPLILILVFGIVCQRVSIQTFYKITVIQISLLLVIDFYQSLPTVLLFNPPNGVTLFINMAMGHIPVLNNGICLFNKMTVLERWQYNLLLPLIMLIESIILLIIERFLPFCKDLRNARKREDTNVRIRFDGLKGFIFTLYFTFLPIIWNCAHLSKCVTFSGKDIFWNAPGQDCDKSVQFGYIGLCIVWTIIFVLVFVFLTEKLFPKYEDYKNLDRERKYIESLRCSLQRLEPFTYMIYAFGYRTQRDEKELEALKRAQDDSMYDITRYTQSGSKLNKIGGQSNDPTGKEDVFYTGVATTDTNVARNRVAPLGTLPETHDDDEYQDDHKHNDNLKPKNVPRQPSSKVAASTDDGDDDDDDGDANDDANAGNNNNDNDDNDERRQLKSVNSQNLDQQQQQQQPHQPPAQLRRQSTTIQGIPTLKKLSKQISTLKQLRRESMLQVEKKKINIYTRDDEKWQLYIAWFIPFIRKYICAFVHACVTGSQLHEDIAFITTNVCVVTLIIYQLFASNLTTIKDNSNHIYILYLFFWLIIMVVSGSSRIVAENENVYENLTTAINVLMWSPLFIAIVFCTAIWFDKLGFKPVTVENRADYK